MKFFGLLLTATLFVQALAAQTNTEDSVKAAVNKLFSGMKNADPAMVETAFADSAVLQTIARTKSGSLEVKNESIKNFAASIATLKAGAADEQIVFETIKIDGPLASVWTPYKFYFDGKFSHCGVNSFQLVRLNGVWKIQYIIDTRRRTGCE
jgi:Putative lumazine-binding